MHDDTHTGRTARTSEDGSESTTVDRRTALAGLATLGAAGLSGCLGPFDDGDEREPFNWIGSGPGRRPATEGTRMAELPDLEGELTVYTGRGRFLVDTLLEDLNGYYDDFHGEPRYGDSSDTANQILAEQGGTNADVFYSASGAPLATLAAEDRTRSLSDATLDMVPAEFHTDSWIGTGGRIRSIPYNTDALSEGDLPDAIADYADLDVDMGWAPGYGACQEFVTAMRVLEGDDAAREWLQGVLDAGIESYGNEQLVCEAIADGEIDLGFTNHYYIQRVQASFDDPPLSTAFTAGDAGATFNVAGAAVIDATDSPELAENFVRHLLSAEAQIFFAERTYEYPLVPEVEPAGDLPSVGELEVPDVDLEELAGVGDTADLMRDVGVDI